MGADGIRGVGTASHHRESRVADCALMSRLQGRQTLEYRVRNYSTVPRETTKSINLGGCSASSSTPTVCEATRNMLMSAVRGENGNGNINVNGNGNGNRKI